ncbi:Uncharacterised protein g7219 [Pycnogonum litorale]
MENKNLTRKNVRRRLEFGCNDESFIETSTKTDGSVVELDNHKESENDLTWLFSYKVDSVVKPLTESENPIKSVIKIVKTDETTSCQDITRTKQLTYSDLIKMSLSTRPLTLRQIYNWISANFPEMTANRKNWKNSVRHTLSVKPEFKRVKVTGCRIHHWHATNSEQSSFGERSTARVLRDSAGPASLPDSGLETVDANSNEYWIPHDDIWPCDTFDQSPTDDFDPVRLPAVMDEDLKQTEEDNATRCSTKDDTSADENVQKVIIEYQPLSSPNYYTSLLFVTATKCDVTSD